MTGCACDLPVLTANVSEVEDKHGRRIHSWHEKWQRRARLLPCFLLLTASLLTTSGLYPSPSSGRIDVHVGD